MLIVDRAETAALLDDKNLVEALREGALDRTKIADLATLT